MNSRIYETTWKKDSVRLSALRREVFIIEQKVPEELEWDEYDESAIHFACEDVSQAAIIGTARLITDAETNKAIIGRLCVAKQFRHQKTATQLMLEALAYCKQHKFAVIELHAQLYLQAFYERFGFAAQGETYMDAGIEHITMVRPGSLPLP